MDIGKAHPEFRIPRAALLALLLSAPAALAFGAPARGQLPEDLGPATIDVSAYPAEYQRTYREVFVPYFSRNGGTARMVNSPLVTSDEWKKEIERIRTRMPCCSKCPFLSLANARALWRFMVYDSARRKTGPNAAAWQALRSKLVERFNRRDIRR